MGTVGLEAYIRWLQFYL